MPSETQNAWAAGIVDADGCVTMRPSETFRHPQLVVDSTDLEILHELINLYGGGLVGKRRTQAHHRQCWSWRLYGAHNVLACLGEIVPYMRCPAKVARARILLDEYPVLTSRCGNYSDTQRAAKYEMENRFMAIGHGRGASARWPRLKGDDSAGEEADLISR